LVADPLVTLFPRLSIGGYQITSAESFRYNCIAWAASKDDRPWWPHPDGFWPPGVRQEETLEAFEAAFATLGYVRCNDETLEPGFEKIVIYVNTARVPKHAARQLPNGRWTSKLGQNVDIEHISPDGLSGIHYGSPILIMRRPRGFLRAMWQWIKDWVA
jgi:hypothetical protein